MDMTAKKLVFLGQNFWQGYLCGTRFCIFIKGGNIYMYQIEKYIDDEKADLM